MILHVDEQPLLVRRRCLGGCWLYCCCLREVEPVGGFEDVFLHCSLAPTSRYVSAKQFDDHFVVVFCCCVLPAVVSHESVDDSFHHAGRVGRIWRNVLIQVERFLEGPCSDAIVFNCDCQVEEVY